MTVAGIEACSNTRAPSTTVPFATQGAHENGRNTNPETIELERLSGSCLRSGRFVSVGSALVG